VLGLWHLGCVTAACTARHFRVTGLDFDDEAVASLKKGQLPVSEPGLEDLVRSGLASGRLQFTSDLKAACGEADILWVTYDTPVDEEDRADAESVLRNVRRGVGALPQGALVLISSQLPVGTCRLLEREFGAQGYRFACSPENLRLGQAIAAFEHPDRVIIGCRDERSRGQLQELFAPFTREIIWMRPESAEMTKHSLNGFLALSVSFMNEVARLCEAVGADAEEVERGLKSESRIGPKAYLSAGNAFAGGTLARDVTALSALGESSGEALELIPAIKRSNDRHRSWALGKLRQVLSDSRGGVVALLGLTYKPGTNTLRRSSAVELARALSAGGFTVRACDPSQSSLPVGFDFIDLKPNAAAALQGADAAVLCTEWPEFLALDWPGMVAGMRRPNVIDARRFLKDRVAGLPRVNYISLGSPK